LHPQSIRAQLGQGLVDGGEGGAWRHSLDCHPGMHSRGGLHYSLLRLNIQFSSALSSCTQLVYALGTTHILAAQLSECFQPFATSPSPAC